MNTGLQLVKYVPSIVKAKYYLRKIMYFVMLWHSLIEVSFKQL